MARIVSSGIQAGATLGAAGMNMAAQKDYNKKYLQGVKETNQTNLDLAYKQNQWNLEQWNRENEYNSPEQQVQRLQGAGLSSAAASQAIEGAGNASHLESADLANQVAPQSLQAPQFDLAAIPNVLGILRELTALRKEESEADVQEASAPGQIGQVFTALDAMKLSNSLNQEELKYRIEANPYSLKSLKFHAQADEFLPKTQKFLLKQAEVNYKLADQNFKFLEQWNPEKLRELGENINKVIEEAKTEREKQNTERAQQGYLGQQTENAQEEKKGIVLRNFGQVLQNTLTKFGSPESVAGRISSMVEDGIMKPNQIEPFFNSVHNYLKTGGKVFSGSPEDRDFLNYFINPAVGKSNYMPFTSKGFINFLHQTGKFGNIDDAWNSYWSRKPLFGTFKSSSPQE